MRRYIEPKEGLQLVPLNDDERMYLKTIYNARWRLLLVTISLMSVLALISGPFSLTGKKMHKVPQRLNSRLGPPPKIKPMHEAYDYEIFGHELTDIELYWFTHLGLLLLINVPGIIIFYKAVNPYRKDLKLGMKGKVGYTIMGKYYFPLTNQYYFNFDNPDLMHYEVDADMYNSAVVGDTAYLYRGKYSKQVFERNGRFTLM